MMPNGVMDSPSMGPWSTQEAAATARPQVMESGARRLGVAAKLLGFPRGRGDNMEKSWKNHGKNMRKSQGVLHQEGFGCSFCKRCECSECSGSCAETL